MTGPQIESVIVVVPVHNEEELLGRCLAALVGAVDAARAAGIHCSVRIVLDECADDSAAIAGGYPFGTVTIDEACVGAARAGGIHSALQEMPDVDRGRVWIANTDADSAVPANWIVHQLALAERGTDVFVGTVRADPTDLSPEHAALRRREYVPGLVNGNVHGASLGIRASVYWAVGGFARVAEHEDVELVARCRAIGAAVTASDRAEVLTSGRTAGRTPGGYAGFLRGQAEQLRA